MRNETLFMVPGRIEYIVLFIALVLLTTACSPEEKKKKEHYFLDGYDHLEFWDKAGNKVAPSEYIYSTQINGERGYFIEDSTLKLYNTREGAPYSGYIRTFHGRSYNLQGEFQDGVMQRLRYWHRNRTLGMDANYKNESGSIWKDNGMLVVNWNSEEMYYLNSVSQSIERIISDTLTSYFDGGGELEYYTVRRDTAYINYYSDGTPRFEMPARRGNDRSGMLRRWHPNGQLQVIGMYKKGEQAGTWIEYDSLGKEIDRIEYPD